MDARTRFIYQRIDKLCNNGMDYWKAVDVARKQADYIEKYKGIFPTANGVKGDQDGQG